MRYGPVDRRELEHMKRELVALLFILCATASAIADENGGAVAHPDWSPNGKQLAFEANWHGARNIYVMNVDGSEQAPVIPQWPVAKLTESDTGMRGE